MSQLTVRNARMFLPSGLVEGDIAIENGKIKEISKKIPPEGEKDLDAEKKLLIPGVIDAHGHFYDHNFSHREDFEHGSEAAAAGGVTSVISMPLDTPIVAPKDIREAIAAGEENSIIDFGLHAGNMTKEAGKFIERDINLGVKTFKLFTCQPYALDREIRRNLMKSIKNAGGISFFHAEDDKIISERKKELQKEGRTDPLAHAEARPNEAEKKAVKEVISDQKDIGTPIHFAHITTRQGANLIKNAKKKGHDISSETCPQFLLFTKEDLKEKGPYLRINPSPKTQADVRELWNRLAEGDIDMVTTDHAPGTKEEKEVGENNIWEAQIGIPGVETLLPIMLSEGLEKNRISLERMVDALCTSPAKRFGFYPRKGTIEEGTDADLVLIDRKKEWKITSENTHYKVGWTPYEGMKIKGKPEMTISRGEIITEGNKILGSPGRGEFLPSKNLI